MEKMVPTELRQIAFKSQEAILAITEYHRRRNITMPTGTALNISFDDDAGVSATINIQEAGGGTAQLRISGETLAAALILFCINRKIPLPADSDKRLQRIGDDGVALFVVRKVK